MAGKNWLAWYNSRYPDLSICTPQGTHLSRAVAFNRHKSISFLMSTSSYLLKIHAHHPESGTWVRPELPTCSVHEKRRHKRAKNGWQSNKWQAWGNGDCGMCNECSRFIFSTNVNLSTKRMIAALLSTTVSGICECQRMD